VCKIKRKKIYRTVTEATIQGHFLFQLRRYRHCEALDFAKIFSLDVLEDFSQMLTKLKIDV
jgi:hypothetical protein